MAYVIEDLEHRYLHSPDVFVENIDFARFFGKISVALDYINYFDLDDEVLRLIWTDGYEDAICDDDLFDEED